MEASDLPDFTGKVVIFYVSNPPAGLDGGVVLEFVEFRVYGDKPFLIGRVPEKVESDWVSRLHAGIAWDSVLHYLIFDSREDYERRVSHARPGLLQRLLGRAAG